MSKKTHFIRIRVDEELKNALQKAAELEDRQEACQARYILRKALGLVLGQQDLPSLDGNRLLDQSGGGDGYKFLSAKRSRKNSSPRGR